MAKNLSALAKATEKSVLEHHRLLSLFLFGDVIYAILPLVVLAALLLLLREPGLGFLQLKEWSFAAIVLFGSVIRKFVRLKVEIQQTPKSYKLDTGIQIFIIFLIMSVIVLSLVLLAEKGLVPADKAVYLGYAQVLLLLLALGSMFAGIVAEDEGIRWTRRLDGNVSGQWLLRRVHRELEAAEEHMQYVLGALDKIDRRDSADRAAMWPQGRDAQRWLRIDRDTVGRLEELLADARRGLESYGSSPAPEHIATE